MIKKNVFNTSKVADIKYRFLEDIVYEIIFNLFIFSIMSGFCGRPNVIYHPLPRDSCPFVTKLRNFEKLFKQAVH